MKINMQRFSQTTFLLACILVLITAEAGIKKCRDQYGKIIYTDSGCPDGSTGQKKPYTGDVSQMKTTIKSYAIETDKANREEEIQKILIAARSSCEGNYEKVIREKYQGVSGAVVGRLDLLEREISEGKAHIKYEVTANFNDDNGFRNVTLWCETSKRAKQKEWVVKSYLAAEEQIMPVGEDDAQKNNKNASNI